MAYIVEWMDDERTLLCVQYKGRLSIADLQAAHSEIFAFLSMVAHAVDMIFDPRQMVYFPPRLGETLQELHRIGLPNLRLMVFLGNSLAWELFTLHLRRSGSPSFALVCAETIEEACEYVRCARSGKFVPTLPPASPDWN